MKILVINGPNLNMLGVREPLVYGRESYGDLVRIITEHGKKLEVETEVFQSNHEGVIVDKIQSAYGACDGIIINPAAYTHTSVAILDALKAVCLPTVEVHISDPMTREPFRHQSFVRPACIATVKGMGLAGYCHAMDILKESLCKL